MAETEVPKEVSKMVALEEKCVLDMSSYQDLPKPDCNGTNPHKQANDLDKSYVFVSGIDGVTEDVGNENVEAEDSRVLGESDVAGVKDQEGESQSQIDSVDGEFQPLNEGEGIIGRSNGDSPIVNVDSKDAEAEGLSVFPDSAGVKDQAAELHSIEINDATSGELDAAENSVIERRNGGLSVFPESSAAGVEDQEADLHSQIDNGEFQPLNEAENSIIEDAPLVNVNNKEVVEAEGSSNMTESDAAGPKDQEAELHSQIENIDAVSENFLTPNEAIGGPSLVNADSKDVAEVEGLLESDDAGLKDQEAELHSQIEKIDAVSQPLNEAGNCIVARSNQDPPLVHVKDVEAGGSTLSESENIDTVDGEFLPLNAAENSIIEQSNWDSPLVNVDNVEAESSSVPHESDFAKEQVAELDSHSLLNINSKNEAEGSSVRFEPIVPEIKDQGAELGSQNESVQVPDGKVESLAEAEVEKALDQNGIVDDVADGEEEKFDSVSKAGSSPVSVENRVSQVGALGLVAESGENRESNNNLLHIIDSLNANGECEDQSNLCITDALEACHESQEMVVDVVQRELQDDEVKPVREEVVEPVENKVSPSTSLDSDSASHAFHSKAETLDEEAKTTLSSEVLDNQQDETAFDNNVQGVLGQMDEAKTVESCTDSHIQTVSNLVLEEQNENFCISEVDNGVQFPEETNNQPESSGVSHDTIPSETKTEAYIQTQSYPPQSETSDLETVGTTPIVCPKSHITENLSPSYDNGIRYPDEVVLAENEPTSKGDEAHAEAEVSSGKVEVALGPSVVELEPEGHDDTFSAISNGGNSDDVVVLCRTEVSDNFNVNKNTANVRLDVEGTEDVRDQLDGTTDDGNKNSFEQENEDSVDSQCSKISVASAEGSSVNTSDGKEQIVKIKTKPFNFLIRVPRFDDENLREQIRVAKIHVDEKTKLRDAVQIQIQEKRANSQIHGIDYEYAKSEARSARKLVRSKRMEIDSLQSVINKAKNALSIEDIDSQIHNMEHMIQHETLPLKEEKQLIREIKQLKQLREQLSSNMGSQDEIKQAIEQRGEVEERLKILRKELDILKNKVLKAEATAAEAEKKYDDENKKVKELQAQFRAADDVRQAAYAQWQNLRKELSKKSEYFFKYKDDAAVASNYAYSRDTEALYLLCTNQVHNFMELWNTNDEFRKEYAKFNTRSTVRRFGTLDGRALGPDEVPPRLPSYADERASRMASTSFKVDPASRIPSPEVKQETINGNTIIDNKTTKKAMQSSYQKVTKEPAITVEANGLDTHPVEVYKEPTRSKDEIESLRREEENRREEAEAKLKEQRRVEALAKANEARERKKRQAEKLQMRADLKTQKEAEQREKEREKRLRKKERKKGGVTDGNDVKSINCESGPSSESAAESSKDIEVVVNESVSKKQGQKPWSLGKQSKGKSIPPPLRNRNKKKLQQWMWVGVTSVMILVLFWLGNIGVFSSVALKRRGPIL